MNEKLVYTDKKTSIPKVWITKHALTQGIYVLENVERCDSIGMDMITYTNPYNHVIYFHNGDWYATEEEAKIRANKMVEKKVKSLKKQLAKYEIMQF